MKSGLHCFQFIHVYKSCSTNFIIKNKITEKVSLCDGVATYNGINGIIDIQELPPNSGFIKVKRI